MSLYLVVDCFLYHRRRKSTFSNLLFVFPFRRINNLSLVLAVQSHKLNKAPFLVLCLVLLFIISVYSLLIPTLFQIHHSRSLGILLIKKAVGDTGIDMKTDSYSNLLTNLAYYTAGFFANLNSDLFGASFNNCLLLWFCIKSIFVYLEVTTVITFKSNKIFKMNL